MWSRVANILVPKPKPDDSSQPRVRMVHRWTAAALQYRWRIVLTKIFAVFKHFERVNHLKALLGYNYQNSEISEEVGKKVYRNLCAEIRVVVKKEVSEAEKPTINRVIGKEVVGKFKGVTTSKKGVPVCEPQRCSHPLADMKKGGNAHSEKQPDGTFKKVQVQWWTCNQCHSSWERYPLPDAQEFQASGSDLVDFGKHKGKTYRELMTHTDYTKWCVHTLTTGDPNKKLRRYAQWVLDQFSLLSVGAAGSQQPAGCTEDMEDETPYPVGWDEAGSVAAASSSTTVPTQHYQIDQEDKNWGYTDAEVADANLAYQEMLRDVAQRTQIVESEEEFEPLSEDQDL